MVTKTCVWLSYTCYDAWGDTLRVSVCECILNMQRTYGENRKNSNFSITYFFIKYTTMIIVNFNSYF